MNSSQEPPSPSPSFSSIPLRFWHGLIGLLAALLGMVAFVVFWQNVVLPMVHVSPQFSLIVQTVGIAVAFIGGSLWGIRKLSVSPIKMFALKSAHPLFFIIAAIGVVFAGTLCDEVVGILHRWKPTFFKLGAIEEISNLVTDSSPVWFVALALGLSVFPAVAEEVMFRGLLFRSFKKDMPTYFAVIYSAVLFGLVHLNWLQGTAAMLLGIYLGYICWLSGSIFPAMLAHFVNNLTWCYVARYEPAFVENVFTDGHSFVSIIVSALVVGISVLAMVKLSKIQKKINR